MCICDQLMVGRGPDGLAHGASGWQAAAGTKGVSDHISLIIHYTSLAISRGGGES